MTYRPLKFNNLMKASGNARVIRDRRPKTILKARLWSSWGRRTRSKRSRQERQRRGSAKICPWRRSKKLWPPQMSHSGRRKMSRWNIKYHHYWSADLLMMQSVGRRSLKNFKGKETWRNRRRMWLRTWPKICLKTTYLFTVLNRLLIKSRENKAWWSAGKLWESHFAKICNSGTGWSRPFLYRATVSAA